MIHPDVQPIIDDVLPLCRALGEGRYAISVGGSIGKGTADHRSDIDLRLFCDRTLSPPETFRAAYAELQTAIDRWAAQGRVIDGCWVRTTGEIDAQLDRWIDGVIEPTGYVWTIWGYYLPTDIMNQAVIEDPHGIIAGWKAKLTPYPPKLKAALLQKHGNSVRYWRQDYHYRHKVQRGDAVFLASLTARLVHDLIQILFALNETYYTGDGNNLHFIETFPIAPDNVGERITAILYPEPQGYAEQATRLADLIDDVESLVDS